MRLASVITTRMLARSFFACALVASFNLALPGAPRAGQTWTQLSPTTPPSARKDASLIYDAGGDRLILFAGKSTATDGSNPTYYEDVWVFSLASSQWSPLSTGGTTPAGRSAHVAIYDPGRPGVSRRMLVFGGRTAAGLAATTVYSLSLTGTPTWSTLSTTGTGPIARHDHVAVYDSGRDQMIVHGGIATVSDAIGPLEDTFALNLLTLAWSSLPPADLPSARAAATYDAVGQRMIVFGGLDYIGPCQPSSSILVKVLSLAPAPSWDITEVYFPEHRTDATVVYDSIRRKLVMYGGVRFETVCGSGVCSSCGYYTEAQAYNDIFLMNLGPPDTWTQMFPTGGPPLPRGHHVAAYDPARDELIVFGGSTFTKSIATCLPSCTFSETHTYYNDTWKFDPDAIAPAAVSLNASAGSYDHVFLAWTAPGDDGTSGTATAYDLRWSAAPITGGNFNSATPIAIGAPLPAGSAEFYTIPVPYCSGNRYYALKTRDEGFNWSAVSNSPSAMPTCPDVIAPAAVSLNAGGGCYDHVFLVWTAPGDDGAIGTATAYDLRWSTTPITEANFPTKTPIVIGAPLPAGSEESYTIPVPYCSGYRYYALKTRDEVFNWSALSNSPSAKPVCPTPPAQCYNAGARPPKQELPVEEGTAAMELARPEPNPADGDTWIRFGVPKDRAGTGYEIAVFDLSGRRVALIEKGSAVPGTHSVSWNLRASDGSRIAPGLHFVRFRLGSSVLTRGIIALP